MSLALERSTGWPMLPSLPASVEFDRIGDLGLVAGVFEPGDGLGGQAADHAERVALDLGLDLGWRVVRVTSTVTLNLNFR